MLFRSSAVNDTTAEGDHNAIVTFTVQSSDLLYNGLLMDKIRVNVVDNDAAVQLTHTDGGLDVKEGDTVGDTFTLVLRVADTGATVNGVMVAAASPATGNGFVHPISMVLQTPETGTVIDRLAVDDRFTTFYSWRERADLIPALLGDGPFTVFARVIDGFLTLPPGTVDFLLLDANTMRTVLLYHVVGGKLMQADLTPQEVLTLAGPSIKISGSAGALLYGASQITGTDLMASNGVIHVVNTALIPPPR